MEKRDAELLNALVKMPSWTILKSLIEEEIESLEYNILNTYDNEVIYSKQDLMKEKRKIYKELIEKPLDVINSF